MIDGITMFTMTMMMIMDQPGKSQTASKQSLDLQGLSVIRQSCYLLSSNLR